MESKEQKYLSIFENCDNFVDLGRHVAYYRKLAGLTQLKLSNLYLPYHWLLYCNFAFCLSSV